jgi:hypothetical protein
VELIGGSQEEYGHPPPRLVVEVFEAFGPQLDELGAIDERDAL